MMLLASTVCVSLRLMLDHTRSRLSVELALSVPLCGMPFGKTSLIGTSRAIEKMLKPVKTSLPGGRRAPGMPPRSSRVQVDQVEDALLVELIGIVELAGDDPPAVRQRVDVGVDERLIVEADFAAGGIAGVVALEGTETVDQPIGLRAVVVRQDRQILAEDDVPPSSPSSWSSVPIASDARDLHGLGAAGELPEQLVAAAQRIGRRWERLRASSVFVNSTR